MKKVIMIALASFACVSVNAQKVSNDNVPAAVTNEFSKLFSLAEKISWEMDYDNYEAAFIVGKSEFSALFDKEGKWLETASYLKPSELPKVIKDMLIKEFGELSAYKIEDAQKVSSADNTSHYEMEIDKGEVAYDMSVAENGTVIKKEELKDHK